MPERNEKVEALLKKIEDGTKAVFESENYKNFLNTMAKFHSYSLNNLILIAIQKPEATVVAGFRAWQTKFHRNVKKGEKGIQIIGYAPKTIRKQMQKRDDSGIPVFDVNGQPVMEMVKTQIPDFRPMYIFDVSQTEGEPLPTLGVDELTGKVERYETIRDTLLEMSPVPVVFEAFPGGAKGKVSFLPNGKEYIPQQITIQPGMSEVQTVKTLIHETAHAFMHGGERNTPELSNPHVRETEAESVAYVVCQHLGLDTAEYSFPYLAGWSTATTLPELKGSLERIREQSGDLIRKLDQALEEAMQQFQKRQNETKQRESGKDTFSIYQVKNDPNYVYYRFISLDSLGRRGLKVARENYDLVYTAPHISGETLEDIYRRFNTDHPADFTGRSLSVSDIVVLKHGDTETAHYCDSVGFKEVPEFLQQEKTPQKPLSFAERMASAGEKAEVANKQRMTGKGPMVQETEISGRNLRE